MPDALDSHYETVMNAMLDGEVVPFLGAGANRCDRPVGSCWQCGTQLPDGTELSEYLANQFAYHQNDRTDLARVAQYALLAVGSGPLYGKLHKLLNANYPLTSLARFLATLQTVLSQKGPPRYQLIVTTNYDDLIERAFQEPFDLVTYVAEGEERGRFLHRSPNGNECLIETPNEYGDLDLDKRTVILKVHGSVDRANDKRDSFVITEDHYIEYLARTDVLPKVLTSKMRDSHLLFLGYSLRDWNLRVILHRIWGERKLTWQSWAIQRNPDPIDEKFWGKHDVQILDVRLEDYIAELAKRLPAPEKTGGGS
jgi:hypothetical protein